jgi:hypothetical protein
MQGPVLYEHQGKRQKAWPGLQLQAKGEILETGSNGRAELAIDTGIGAMYLAEKTRLSVQSLDVVAGGGRVTQIQVLQGQVHLQVRPFSNPDSRLNIKTPTGIVGVRGTDFGVIVQANGRTGVAVLTGRVEAAAQRQSVFIDSQSQTVIHPGEAPLSVGPLNNDPQLTLTNAPQTERQSDSIVRLVGRVDPSHLLIVDGVNQSTNRDGSFDLSLSIQDQAKLRVTVITPLGNQRRYELPLR